MCVGSPVSSGLGWTLPLDADPPWRDRSPQRGISTVVIPNVENDICVITRDGRYFQSVAMPNAAAINPMPIRMFQFPRSLISGMV